MKENLVVWFFAICQFSKKKMHNLVPKYRLDIFKNHSFQIPFENPLTNDVIKSSTLGQFRRSTSNFSKDSSAPMHFNFGKRMFNIIHTKLRRNCILNYDLYRTNIVDTPNCSCGKQENAYHFFFICKKYSVPGISCSTSYLL